MDTFKGRTEGVDVDGVSRKLGERDSMGHIVGFIDDDYNCWETIAERDGALTAGRYQDAMQEWENSGKKDLRPNPLQIAKEVCLDPDNVPAAVYEAKECWEFLLKVRPIAKEKMVEEIIERFKALEEPSIQDLKDELDKWPFLGEQ